MMKGKSVLKRILSFTLSAAMAVTMLPAQMASAAEGDAAEMPEQLAYFSFDKSLTDGGNAVAVIDGKNASINKGDTHTGKGGALELGGQTWLTLAQAGDKNDNLINGKKELTISYWSKTTSDNKTNSNAGWAWFASRNNENNAYPNEHYIGVMDTPGQYTVQRWNNAGSRKKSIEYKGSFNAWKMVTVVMAENSTTLYLDGQEAEVQTEEVMPLDGIITATSKFMIGKANWEGGEYYTGLIDDFTIFDGALSEAQVKAYYDETLVSEGDTEPKPLAVYDFEDGLGEGVSQVVSGNGSAPAAYTGEAVFAEGRPAQDGQAAGKAVKVGCPQNAKDGYGLKLNHTNLGTEYTASMWVRPDENNKLPNNMTVLFIGKPNPEKWVGIAGTENNNIKLWTNDSGNEAYNWKVVGTSGLPSGQWSMLTVTQSGEDISFYKDGALVFAGKATEAFNGENQNIYIAANPWDNMFNGLVDDVYIYDKALSQSQVRYLYDGSTEGDILEKDGFTTADIGLFAGESQKADVILPSTIAGSAKVTYSISDTEVAEVAADGTVTAKAEGETKLRVAVKVGRVTRTQIRKVTVYGTDPAPLASYNFNATEESPSGTLGEGIEKCTVGMGAYEGETEFEAGRSGREGDFAVKTQEGKYGLKLPQGKLQNYTVTLWAKVSSLPGWASSILFAGKSSPEEWISIAGDDGKGSLICWASGNRRNGYTNIAANEWTMFTLVQKGASASIYKNGQKVELPDNWAKGLLYDGQYLALGVNNWDRVISGAFDDVKVYGVALTDAQVAAKYAAEDPKVESCDPIAVETSIGIKPELPKAVKVHFVGGTEAEEEIIWPEIEESKYASAGTFEVTGKLRYFDTEVTASVTVRPLSDRLMAHYTFDEDVLADASGKKGNAEKVNTVSQIDGLNGKAVQLPGGGANKGSVKLPEDLLLKDGKVQDDFTVSMYVKRANTQQQSTALLLHADILYDPWTSSNSTRNHIAFINRDSERENLMEDGLWVEYNTKADTSSTLGKKGDSQTTADKWEHIAIVTKGSTGEAWLYKNSRLIDYKDNITVKASDLAGRLNYLGACDWPDSDYAGAFDDLKVYDTVLSAGEVKDICDSGFKGSLANAVKGLEIGYAEGDSAASVTSDLTLPNTIAADGVEIRVTWESSDLDVIDGDGLVNRLDSDQEITLTATAALMDTSAGAEDSICSEKKEFKVTVLAGSGIAALKNAVIKAQKVSHVLTQYFADGQARFKKALKDAQELLEKAQSDTTVEIDKAVIAEAITRLDTAQKALYKRTSLDDKIREAYEELAKDIYTTASKEALDAAVRAANRVNVDPASTKAEFQNAEKNLQDAIAQLVLRPDASALKALVADVEALDSADYTSASWKALQQALAAAQAALADGDSTADALETAKNGLSSARDALVARATASELNSLYAEIAAIQQMASDDYTSSSWAAVQKAVTDANTAAGSEVKADVTNAKAELQKAKNDLVNISALKAAIAEAGALTQADYTSTTWAGFRGKLDSANTTAANGSATQADVNTALQELNEAKSALVKRSDISRLTDMIAALENLSAENYTAASWAAFSQELVKAKAVTNETPQSEVDAAISSLGEARDALVKLADKTDLNARIAELQVFTADGSGEEANYTSATWASLKEALLAAQAVAAKENATDAEVSSALQSLNDKFTALLARADKLALNRYIAEAEEMDKSDYTKESVAALEAALTEAKAVQAELDAPQDTVNEKAAALREALIGLKIAAYNVIIDTANCEEAITEQIVGGQLLSEPQEPSREGYTFAGWYCGDKKYNFSTPITADITITARWKSLPSVADAKVKVAKAIYNGKARKPEVTVTLNGRILIETIDFTVKYSNNTKVGQGSVTIRGIEGYIGSKTVKFNIVPAKVKSVKLTNKTGRKAAVKFAKATGAKGYQVTYAANSSFKSAKSKDVKKNSLTLSGLKKNKTYYVKVRAYTNINGKKVYGAYSTKVKVQIKK